MDTIYEHALKKIADAIKSMVVPDVIVPVGGGMLTIKDARITEAKLAHFERQLLPPNRLKSRFTGGRVTSIGQWQYRPMGGQQALAQGIFRIVVTNVEMNVTNQLGRTWDAKPMVNTQDCKAYLGQFRVEIEGFGDNTTVIDQCENLLCQRIRAYFEDSVCNTARTYVKDTINQKLATFPTRINLGSTGNRFVLDYGLLTNEPKVNQDFIQAYLEGDVLSRGTGSAPFNAPDIQSTNDSQKMISFPMTDYAFNTLFYHAHNQQYRFSAFDLLANQSTLRNWLKLNCSSTTAATPSTIEHQRKFKATHRNAAMTSTSTNQFCLGLMFENQTNSYPIDATGDLVFKSQRPVQIMIRQQPQKNPVFQQNVRSSPQVGGTIEAYGPMGVDGKRDLLGRVDIQKLMGEFVPKLNACNITGQVTFTDLQLIQSSQSRRLRTVADNRLTQLSRMTIPIMTEMFNSFLTEYAQFPIPLLDGYECTAPEIRSIMPRSMQIDCDVRVLAEATRKAKSN
jgi:hypothetical protein